MSHDHWSAEDVITFMAHHGWTFNESPPTEVERNLVVWFSRKDWHGYHLEHEITISTYGSPDDRNEMVRKIGREALEIWGRFPGQAPAQYYELDTRELIWDVRRDYRTR
nr:hypothetical protein 18 [Spirochaetaceae bacterium]